MGDAPKFGVNLVVVGPPVVSVAGAADLGLERVGSAGGALGSRTVSGLEAGDHPRVFVRAGEFVQMDASRKVVAQVNADEFAIAVAGEHAFP